MLTPSKKIYYAIEAVLFIAYNAKATPISGTQVAEAQGLPTRYLEPIMQRLVRAGILVGMICALAPNKVQPPFPLSLPLIALQPFLPLPPYCSFSSLPLIALRNSCPSL